MPVIPQEVELVTAAGTTIGECTKAMKGKLKTYLLATDLRWRLTSPVQPIFDGHYWHMVATLTRH